MEAQISNEVLLFLHVGSAFMLVSAAAVNMMLKRSKNTQAIAMLMGLRLRTTLVGLLGAILARMQAGLQRLTSRGQHSSC